MALLNTLEKAAAVVDAEGRITGANAAWRRLREVHSWLGNVEQGEAVLDEAGLKKECREAEFILQSILNVRQGLQPECDLDFPLHQANKPSWLRLFAKPLAGGPEGCVMLFLEDATARCKAELDLRESHSLFQRVVEGTGEGVFIYDREGRFLMHNAICLELFSAGSASLVGKHVGEVFPAPFAQTDLGQNQLVLETGRPIWYELTVDTSQGKRCLMVQKRAYRNHRNEVVGVIGIARDITERKQAEEELERSERHFRALIEKSRDCIVLLSHTGRITYASPPAREIFGFEIEELIGTDVFFWVHPDDAQFAMQRFQEALELPDAAIISECRILCKDGQWKWAEATATNLLHDPDMEAIVLNVRDISERKNAEQESRRFEAIVESSIDGILALDMEGKITSWNPGAERIFGYSEAQMLGVAFRSLTPEDRLKECSDFAESVRRGKAIRDCETVRLGQGGVRIEVSLTFSPIRDQERRIAGTAVIVRDITERRRLEKEVLEIADFEKHRIGQDLHDDLCQHLVAITMISNLLHSELAGLDIPQAEKARQIAGMTRNAVDHARNLAKGLSPLNIAQVGLMAGLETLVAHTELMFRTPCCLECPEAVHIEDADVAMHLYRIAQEALHNAVKHSDGTQVVVHLKADEQVVEIGVSDNGIGLPDSQNKPDGGGMGMHTMQYRARMIGARLEIFKNDKGGTSVVCRLPKKALTAAV